MEKMEQPAFRAKQLYEWLYWKNATSYDEMTNLSKALRQQLADAYPLYAPEVVDRQISHDGTRKYVLRFHDGAMVETVAIPADATRERLTVCFSTQVGCPMECLFCATGKEGFTRNLSVGEMVDQIFAVEKDFGKRVSNVVAMGQGEPFLNYDNVLAALRIMNDGKGLGIGARRITVSTCGLISGIERFCDEPEQFTLAVSLHSAVQETRDTIMPKVKNQPLDKLHAALAKSTRRTTFEYLLMSGINDGEEALNALVSYCRGLSCHVNILPMNAVEGSGCKASSTKTVNRWLSTLERNHIEATLRTSRGADIAGACGQLKNKLSGK